MKRFDLKDELKTKIMNNLISIEAFTEGAYEYITEPERIYDLDEIKISLEAVPEYISDIEKYLYELINEYNKELEYFN